MLALLYTEPLAHHDSFADREVRNGRSDSFDGSTVAGAQDCEVRRVRHNIVDDDLSFDGVERNTSVLYEDFVWLWDICVYRTYFERRFG